MPANRMSPSSLSIIRLSLIGGVLLFGVVIGYLHATGAGPEPADSLFAAPVFTWVFFALCAGAAVAIIALRGMAERATAFERSASIAIAAWAIGEGVALLGGVHWLLTGAPILFIVGVVLFLTGLATVSASG